MLLLPHPKAGDAYEHAFKQTKQVLAVTDHLTNDHRLINYAATFTEKGGTLYLCHVEDQLNFQRTIEAISKIPTIETADAERRLGEQLLKEPRNYINSCRGVLDKANQGITVEAVVEFGHHLAEYRKVIEKEQADLLVMNTKDDDQLAMHGLAYPLAVELRQLPLLML